MLLSNPMISRPAAPFAPRRVLATLAALAALLVAPSPAAAGNKLSNQEVADYNDMVTDTLRAGSAIPGLRAFLGNDPDTTYALFVRRMLVRALIVTHAPGPQVTASIDSAAQLLPRNPQVAALFYAGISQDLLDRGIEPAKTLVYARRAAAAAPNGMQAAPLRSVTLDVLGRAQIAGPKPDSAIATLVSAIEFSPDSQKVLFHLGQAYEKVKKPDPAINAYTRSLSVYLGADTSAAAPLRALWRKKNGSLAGLDGWVKQAQAASRKSIALDAHRHERPAPGWTLPDLDGKPVTLDDFKGKVIVMDFWGSWCGPCRIELPIFQAAYERYKDKGVVFLGMNFERPVPGKDLVKIARDFVTENKYTFPVIVDHDQIATTAYGITGFPTLFLIDKTGKIRYRNIGVTDGIETILQDQIESLMQ
jgi:thiol-disulfide isomerase/thioredoxin